ncbi:hypothetical protein TrRE_jg6473 [Triparma retinervis]|uniref:Uncharacterized protein n=1 Tax=Triparma retinervis TaxID=2557542 RepID=A0A9W7AMB7_9STRA|nr:hypothetical protein TrRE_jg6473 [Triparma retinervis]
MPFRAIISNPSLQGLSAKACKEFAALVLNADNVLLSYQRNALISSICGVGVISYRSQSHLARTMSNGGPSSFVDDDGDDKFKPVTGICLIGLGFYFFSFGTVQYYSTLRMLGRTCFEDRTGAAKKFLSSDLTKRFLMNGVFPSIVYAASISALFHSSTRKFLSDLTPRIVTHRDLEQETKTVK